MRFSGRITREQAEEAGMVKAGRSGWLRKALLRLPVGELYKVHRTDWKWKKDSPLPVIKRLNTKNYRFELYKTADDSGWIVKRKA